MSCVLISDPESASQSPACSRFLWQTPKSWLEGLGRSPERGGPGLGATQQETLPGYPAFMGKYSLTTVAGPQAGHQISAMLSPD